MKLENLIAEIIRKAENMNYFNLSVAGGAHIEQHVGQTNEELLSRRKAERLTAVSTFTDVNTVNVVLWECFTDEYTVMMTIRDIRNWQHRKTSIDFDGKLRLLMVK